MNFVELTNEEMMSVDGGDAVAFVVQAVSGATLAVRGLCDVYIGSSTRSKATEIKGWCEFAGGGIVFATAGTQLWK